MSHTSSTYDPSAAGLPHDGDQPLQGGMLILAAIVLAMANFIAVLDMTIANVSVPTIAGGLGATTAQGTWVITSYAVAEAITVPLTGWLAARFGAVRVFCISMAMFGLFSVLCGFSTSLEMLVVFRIFQGLAGGPLMPLSQTLLLRIFPAEKAGAAVGLWAMTTVIAPILGPILGGWLCDNYSWHWIFLINLPFALVGAATAWKLLKRYEEALQKAPIDIVGLILLIVWVGCLQLVLDEGKNLDWFASTEIVALSVIAVIGFAAFLIWELHDDNPIVDLRVFRHRGFSAAVLTISLAFAGFFGINVLTPQWLQGLMGYTSTEAGMATAWIGVLAVVLSPVAAGLSMKVDPRKLVFFGVMWLGLIILWRSFSNIEMTYWDIAIPMLLMGIGMPFFFVPLTGLAMASVDEREMASAAGLMNFLRTISGAFATSVITTQWDNQTTVNHATLVGDLDRDGSVRSMLENSGMTTDAINATLDQLLNGQSIMLATNQIFMATAVVMFIAAFAIWLAPRPTKTVDPAAAGGH